MSDMYHYITAAIYRRQTAHLHETISQFFIIILKVVRLSLDFMWNGSVLEISGPKYLILLAPEVIWFLMGTSRLGLYWFRYRIFFKKRYGNTRIGGFLFSVRVALPFFIPYAFWWNMRFSALSLFIWLLFETSVMVL